MFDEDDKRKGQIPELEILLASLLPQKLILMLYNIDVQNIGKNKQTDLLIVHFWSNNQNVSQEAPTTTP